MDAAVALAALGLAMLTSILFGLLPAWRLQRTLVVAEVALSIAALACDGLMLRSFLNLSHAPLGFEPAGVVTARVPFDQKRFPDTERRWGLCRTCSVAFARFRECSRPAPRTRCHSPATKAPRRPAR